MKKDNCKENIAKLNEIIDEWQINKCMLAKKMGMGASTLRLKLSPGQPAYNLTEEEFRVIMRYLFLMTDQIRKLYVKGIHQTPDKLSTSK